MAGVPPNGFEGLLGDLLKAMGGAPAAAWFDAAKGLAVSVVADEQEGYNPDPVARIRLEELARVVAMHVGEVTGAAVETAVEPATRAAWAVAALTSWRARLEPLVATSAAPPPIAVAEDDARDGDAREVRLVDGADVRRAPGRLDRRAPRRARPRLLGVPPPLAHVPARARSWCATSGSSPRTGASTSTPSRRSRSPASSPLASSSRMRPSPRASRRCSPRRPRPR